MSAPANHELLSRVASLRRGHAQLRDAEMRRRGSLEHQVLDGCIKLAGLRSCAREQAAEAESLRDWARLERLVAAMSVIAMFVVACVANYAAWQIFRGSFTT